jgi:exodeoxyribonuclease V alpha subunit
MSSRLNCHPIDRTKTEHYGFVERVIWYDRDQPVSILALTDGKTIVVRELPDAFDRGPKYRFLGKWTEGKHGPQFQADTWVVDSPHSKLGVLKYLSDTCSGVGLKTANKLFEQYESKAVEILRSEPSRVVADGLLSEEDAARASEELQSSARLEKTRIDLFSLFSGRGFPASTIEDCIRVWGVAAPSVIQKDPYKLLTARVRGCGWKRADKLHAELGKPRDTLKRGVLAGWNAIREDRTGSTWLDAADVVEHIRNAAPEVKDIMRAIRLGIRAGVFRIRRDGERRWIAIAEYARAEQRIADAVRRLNTHAADWGEPVPMSVTYGDGLPSAHQAREMDVATTMAVGCFTGGPGTGKSHTVSYLLWMLTKRFGSQKIAVAAPTGIAAHRITQYLAERGLSIRATTIHRLLEIGRNGQDGGGWGFLRWSANPIEQRYLIVDEASMIDANLLADLLEACATGTHVLFVGDPFQLPPVGHGAPLRDLIAAGVPTGQLAEVRRNSGTIVEACAAIKDGAAFVGPTRLELDAENPVNLRFVECQPSETLDTIESILRNAKRFDPIADTQILVANNEKSEVSRKAVNERFQKVLNPGGIRVEGIPFAVGDKVICLKNSTLKLAEYHGRKSFAVELSNADRYQTTREETYVANGDTGRVLAVGKSGAVVSFGGRQIWLPKSKPKKDDEASGGAMGDFDLAYGITTHKSQGSQWQLVIVIADKSGGSVADKNWWYTAISRAQKACLIVGDVSAFATQSRRETLSRRKTFLSEILNEETTKV